MKKLLLALSLTLLCGASALASDGSTPVQDSKFNMKIDTRFDGRVILKEDASVSGGFAGSYLKLIMSGAINEQFEYGFRYRLYRDAKEGTREGFFNAVDWAFLTWNISKRVSLTVGKQIIYVGGFEYDYAPIDVYFASQFWNTVSPYQIGFNVGFSSLDKRHSFKLQMTNSPFNVKAIEDKFAYSAIWYGTMGCYSTAWSVNAIEYDDNKYTGYLALGNKLSFDKVAIDLDYMIRTRDFATFGRDYSLIGKVAYSPIKQFTIFAKGGYDQNRAEEEIPGFIDPGNRVAPGYNGFFYGAGVEFFPLKTNNVRFHLVWHSSSVNPITNTLMIGARWTINAIDRK